MEHVPFFALHGLKVTTALVVLATGLGVWLYLRKPARRARERRRRIALPQAVSLSEVSTGDEVTIEGQLVGADELDLGDGDRVALASLVTNPGRQDESRKTTASEGLVIAAGDRRVTLDGPIDLRAGSRELYPHRAPSPRVDAAMQNAAKRVGVLVERETRLPALLAVRSGDRVRVRGVASAIASGRESDYRESESDFRLSAGEGRQIALWHPSAPAAGGGHVLGALWRALWVGGLTYLLILGAAHVSLELTLKVDDPRVQMRLADVASLSPDKRYWAARRYTEALETLEPTRERGRAIAGLYELHERCDHAARTRFARQDLGAAAASADRCPSAEAHEIAIAAHLLRGDVDGAARLAAESHQPHHARRALSLALRAGAWEEASAILSRRFKDGANASCMEAWIAAQRDQKPSGTLPWRSSPRCTSLRADLLEGQARLEFLRDVAPVDHLGRLLALEAALADNALPEIEGDDGDDALIHSPVITAGSWPRDLESHPDDIVDQILSERQYRTERGVAVYIASESERVFDWIEDVISSKRFGSGFPPRLPLSVAIADRSDEASVAGLWDIIPAKLALSGLAAVSGDPEEARRIAETTQWVREDFASWREHRRALVREHEDVFKREPPDDLPSFERLFAFLEGDIPSAGDLFGERSSELDELIALRRACADSQKFHPDNRFAESNELFERACQGDPRALFTAGPRDRRAWESLRPALLAIGPVLGEAPEIPTTLASAPILPARSPPQEVPEAYALATQMQLVYGALGDDERKELWRKRARALRDHLLAREPAVALIAVRRLAAAH